MGVDLLCLDDDGRTERFLTAAAARFASTPRITVLLAFLDLRRGQPEAAVARIRAAAEKAPNNIELLLARAEILTFAGAADAPDVVRSLLARAADALLHNAPYPVSSCTPTTCSVPGRPREAATILDEIAAANRKSLMTGVNWPMVFVQNGAIHALRGESTAALDELDRAYAAGWRDGRTLAIDPCSPRFVASRDSGSCCHALRPTSP